MAKQFSNTVIEVFEEHIYIDLISNGHTMIAEPMLIETL